jgi:hypothetical protein
VQTPYRNRFSIVLTDTDDSLLRILSSTTIDHPFDHPALFDFGTMRSNTDVKLLLDCSCKQIADDISFSSILSLNAEYSMLLKRNFKGFWLGLVTERFRRSLLILGETS